MMRFSPAFVAAFVALVNGESSNTNPAMYFDRALNCYNSESTAPEYSTAGMGKPSELDEGHIGVAVYFKVPDGQDTVEQKDMLVAKNQGTCGTQYASTTEHADPAGTFFTNWQNVQTNQTSDAALDAIRRAADDGQWHAGEIGNACVFLGNGAMEAFPWLSPNANFTYGDAMAWTNGTDAPCREVELNTNVTNQGGLIWCALPDTLLCEIDNGDVPTTTAAPETTTEPCEEHLTIDSDSDTQDDPLPTPDHAATLAATLAVSAMAMLA